MALPNLNDTFRNAPVFDNRSTLDKLQQVAEKATEQATQPRRVQTQLVNLDADVILAKGGTQAETDVMGTQVGVDAKGEATAEANAYANVEASHDITQGDANVSAKAGAMVGTKVTSQVGGDVAGANLDVIGEAWTGTGVEAEANATMDNWNIELELKAGVGVDLGGSLDTTFGNLFGIDKPITGGAFGTRIGFDAKPIVDGATEAIDEAVDNAKDNVDAATELVEDAIETVEDTANDAAEKAEDFVEDTGEAVSDFIGNLF